MFVKLGLLMLGGNTSNNYKQELVAKLYSKMDKYASILGSVFQRLQGIPVDKSGQVACKDGDYKAGQKVE